MSLAIIEQVSEQIKKEIRVDEQGRGFISIRGAARLADVDHAVLVRAFQGGDQKPSQLARFLIQNGFEGGAQKGWNQSGIPDLALTLILEYYGYEAQERYRREQAKAAYRAFSSMGIRVWMRQTVGWSEQREPVLERISPVAFQAREVGGNEEIKIVVADWLGDIFAKTRILVNEVSRESDRCFALIAKKASDEQLNLVNAIKKGIDEIELEIIARKAINSIMHRVPHQPGKISKVIDEQIHSYQEEFVQSLVAQLMALQVLKQPALPPAEEFPVQRTSSDRRRAVAAFIFDLVNEYGSLDAIPRRGRGMIGADLEVEWGAAKLSKQFGVSYNTVLGAWREVEDAISRYGVEGARQRLI